MVMMGLMFKEALNSVAIEHPEGCSCDICRAAGGDRDAFGRVWVAVQDGLEERERRAAQGE